MRYFNFDTYAFDLGIFNQSFFTALHGKLFLETPDSLKIPSASFLGTHFSILMFFILPIYAIHPSPITLLILQNLILTLPIIPIWYAAKALKLQPKIGLIFVIIYACNPSILSTNMYDFHLEAFLPLFTSMLIYSILSKRWKLYAVSLFLTLATIDFGSIIAFFIAISYLCQYRLSFLKDNKIDSDRKSISWLSGNEPKILLLSIAVSIVTFYVFETLTTLFSGYSTTATSAVLVPFGFIGSVQQGLVQKIIYWILQFVVLGFTSFFSPVDLISIIPWLMASTLSHIVTYYIPGYQYAGAFVTIFLIIAAMKSFPTFKRKKVFKKLLLVGIILSIGLMPLNPLTQGHIQGMAYEDGLPLTVNDHNVELQRVINMIPANASVLTQNNIFPQLSSRNDAFVTANNTSFPQYILEDALSSWSDTKIWGTPSINYWLSYYLQTGNYGILYWEEGIVLLKYHYVGPIMKDGVTTYNYNPQNINLANGQKIGGTLFNTPDLLYYNSTSIGNFFYGPYSPLLPGYYNASFFLKKTNYSNFSLNLTLYLINSQNLSQSDTLTQIKVTSNSLNNLNGIQPVNISFYISPEIAMNKLLHFVGSRAIGGPIYLNKVELTNIQPPTNFT